MTLEDERVPEEHADEKSGSGGADSPEEAVGEPPAVPDESEQDEESADD
jgi:hypothetical protein